ncbi:MAG: adenylate/guanylate cyclase domain-containing protein [Granulosicoccus sp.]
MNKRYNPAHLSSVLGWLVESAVAEESYDSLFDELCNKLRDIGLPLLRGNMGMNTLHPLVESVGLMWIHGKGLTVDGYAHGSNVGDIWLRSPLYWMVSNNLGELRQNLNDAAARSRFPVFADLVELGGTDYLALATRFGKEERVNGVRNGIVTSWVSDSQNGFDEEHIEALRQLQPYLALVAKLSQQQNTAANVVSAFLGKEVGKRVLKGQIQLGDVECIPAVIWLCDLRNSTAMAEQANATDYLKTLNTYFSCTAGAVVENGGQILHFLGDAVLAIFPVTQHIAPAQAAEKALEASVNARKRLRTLNQQRIENDQNTLDFGLALHLGDVLYGNIGIPDRIEFTVIGRAVNEVSRLESLTKEVGEPLLVSKAFKSLVDQPWRSLGTYEAKGVNDGLEVYAPGKSLLEVS